MIDGIRYTDGLMSGTIFALWLQGKERKNQTIKWNSFMKRNINTW